MPRRRKPQPRPHERARGSGTVRLLPSGRWQAIRAREHGTQHRPSRTFADRALAEAWAAGEPKHQTLTLGVWLNRQLALQWPSYRPSTQENYTRYVAACAPLASRPLADLTLDDWQMLTNVLLDRWARSRVRVWRQAINSLLKPAIRRFIDHNHLRDVKLPRAVDQPARAWKREEVARLLVACQRDRHAVWFQIAIGTGARLGELRALTWADVDLRERRISITKSMNNGKQTIGPTKSGKHRTVDLPDELVPVLTAHRARQKPSQRLVFGDPHDRAYSGTTYWRVVQRICDRAGVRRLPQHSLRHAAASTMLAAGVSPVEVAAQLGHTVGTLLSTYSHLINADERRGARALGALFSAVSEPAITDFGAGAEV
jgi:integrase